MDRHAAWLDRRVADAADAWLADPRDRAIYARLVDAICERRAYLNPRLGGTSSADQGDLLDELAGPAVRLGDVLGRDDPHQILRRLRDGVDAPPSTP